MVYTGDNHQGRCRNEDSELKGIITTNQTHLHSRQDQASYQTLTGEHDNDLDIPLSGLSIHDSFNSHARVSNHPQGEYKPLRGGDGRNAIHHNCLSSYFDPHRLPFPQCPITGQISYLPPSHESIVVQYSNLAAVPIVTESPTLRAIYDIRSSAAGPSNALTPNDHGAYTTPISIQDITLDDGLVQDPCPQTTIVDEYGNEDMRLMQLADQMLTRRWLQCHEAEPPLSSSEEYIRRRLPPGNQSRSRFDLFYDQDLPHRCRWVQDGTRCTHQAKRNDRARGHARSHMGYKPFNCDGKCEKAKCTDRYHCLPSLLNHIRRIKQPMRICKHCHGRFTAQNLARHTHGCRQGR